MTMNEMLTTYGARSAAHLYLVGFTRDGGVWYVLQSWAQLMELCKPNRASSKRGGYAKVRVLVPAKLAAQWVADGTAQRLADEDELVDPKWNRGDTFERLVVERLVGRSWSKDSTPFWVAGDCELNGQQVQVKLSGAELTNERALTTALAS